MSIRPRRSLADPALRRPSALKSVPRDASLLWLDKNENLDPALMEVARDVLMNTPPVALATYPEAGEVYRKLAAWAGVSPESLLLTPGSDGAIRLVFEAFVEHGEPVVHTSPTFAMYPVYSQMFGAAVTTIEYGASPHGPSLDLDRLTAVIRETRPKLVCLPNPDSPTGTTVPEEALRDLLAECEAAEAVLLLDEAYHPFHPWTAAPWTAGSRNLIIARTCAKAWGAAGLRVGYAIAHPDTIGLLHKMRPMYEVSTIAVEFLSRMLDRQADMQASVDRLQAGKRFFAAAMAAHGFPVLMTAGNFMHVKFGERAPRVHAALNGRVLYRADFDHPSLAGYSRFSVAPQPIMAKVAGLIDAALESRS